MAMVDFLKTMSKIRSSQLKHIFVGNYKDNDNAIADFDLYQTLFHLSYTEPGVYTETASVFYEYVWYGMLYNILERCRIHFEVSYTCTCILHL